MAFTNQGLCCELYFGSSDAATNTEAYSEYEARRDQIERDFGGELSFQPLPDKKACRIAVYLPEADVNNTAKHAEYTQWLMEPTNASGAPSKPPAARSRPTNQPKIYNSSPLQRQLSVSSATKEGCGPTDPYNHILGD